MNTFTYRRNPDDKTKLADMAAVNSIVEDSKNAVSTYKKIQELSTLREELSSLNAARGGTQGLKGFIMESLEANAQNQAGHRAIVIDDNGIADLIIGKGKNAETVQIKCGYAPGQIDFAKYKEAGVSRFMLNRDHPRFAEISAEAKKYGYHLEPTSHSAAECQMIADGMQLEYKITGNPKTFFVPHAYTTQQAFNLIAQRGVAAAQAAAKFGGALAVSVGIAEVLAGKKSMEEAAKDAFNMTADAAFYGATGNMIMSTALGPIVTTAIASTANGIAGAVASTAVGAKLIVAGSAVADATSAVTAAGAIFKIGGVTATALSEVTSLAAAGTYALGMGGVSAGIISIGGGVATTLGALTGGAAIATGLVTTGIAATTAALGSVAATIFCPPVSIGLALVGLWRFLKN